MVVGVVGGSAYHISDACRWMYDGAKKKEKGLKPKGCVSSRGHFFIQARLQILADAPGRAPPESEPRGIMQRPHPTSPSRPVPAAGLATASPGKAG